MTRTPVPAGLPVPDPTESYWQTPKHELANHRTTEELPLPDEVVDYVVVGSGITGSLISYKLLEQEKDVLILMLEAREACSGATGRNGGHCRAGRYQEFSADLATYGLDEALRFERLEADTIASVVSLIRKENIQCDLRSVEGVELWTETKDLDEMLANIKTREQVAEKIRYPKKIWAGDELDTLLIPDAKGAVSFQGWVLSPYKFICSILAICLQKNETKSNGEEKKQRFNLQTTTPVLDVEKVRPRSDQKGHTTWRVTTPRGIVTAKNVVLATNAYTAALYPPLSDFIVPTRGQITALRPGKKIEGNPVLEMSMAVFTRETCDYFQSRAEWFSGAGDIIVGGAREIAKNGHGQFSSEQPILDDSTINPDIAIHQVASFTQNFGRENWGEEGDTIMQWTGIMGYTRDTQPVVGKADEGLWVCVGFNGHGMALVERCAEALVGLIEGRESEVREWFPRSYGLERVVGK